jgi:hypothetical protein
MSKVLLGLGLVGLAVLALVLGAGDFAPTGQRRGEDTYGPAPEAASTRANSGGPRFNYTAFKETTPSSPLVLAPTSVPLGAGQALAAGILVPTPLPAALSDAAIQDWVQTRIARLDPDAQPVFVAMRPVTRGELQAQGIVGRDDGDQVFVVVHCPQCNIKGLMPTTQPELRADYLTFVCERHYAGCRLVAGPDSPLVRQVRSRPNTAALPTAVPRRGVEALTVEPPFSR